MGQDPRQQRRGDEERYASPRTPLTARSDPPRPSPVQQQQYSQSNQGSTRSQSGAPKQQVQQQQQQPAGQQQAQQPQQQRQPTFPWQTVRLVAGPPVVFPRPGVAQPTTVSPLPFPRYGHSLPATSNAAGELYLFGGLVREAVRDDLYCINTKDLTVKLVSTIGEVPSPRVGHASALVSSVLIVWGGDTNSKAGPGEPQDDSLYLLNLVTSEWTKVTTPDPTPVGRYGHAVTMVGTKFYVFGGQADLEFLNDLWAFDLSSLRASAPTWDLVWPAQGNEPPPRRTGHVCVTHQEKIYVFGGTDGKFHYNDTWVFDVTTRMWSELTCIGFIPAAREGHAAALVDDVIYIFGGRGVDGKDLNDLAAFKISNSRWFTFTRMGDPPSGRSGHAMASVNGRVFVLGGESSFDSTRDENPAIVHVLETRHIRYPDASQPPQAGVPPPGKQPGRRPSAQALIERERAMSPGSTGLSDTEDIRRQMAASPPNAGGRVANGQPAMQSFAVPAKTKGAPVRPRRDGDEAYGMSDTEGSPAPAAERARSPDAGRGGARSPSQLGPARAVSPTQGMNGAPNAAQRVRNGISNANARSPSPVVERAIPPADAFRYAKTGGATSPVAGRPGSTGNVAADLVRDLRTKEGELDGMRRREAWLRAALSRAKKEGFVLMDVDPEEGQEVVEDYANEDMKRVSEAVLKLKQERAKIQALVVENARAASERVADADRVRAAALQEAAFARAKLAAYEAGQGAEVAKLERERAAELERQLAAAAGERSTQERRANEAQDQLGLQTRLREQAESRAAEALRRADSLEEAYERIRREHSDLRERHDAHAITVREQSERLVEHASLVSQLTADHSTAESQLEELRISRDEHVAALEQAQKALSAAAQRSDEMEAHWARARDEVARLQAEVHELRGELEQRISDAENAAARLEEVENNWAKEREEADHLRAFTNDSLTKLLDSHRDLRADEDRTSRGHTEKLSAMEMESTSLRKMLKEAGQRVTEAQTALQEQQRRAGTLETEQSSLRAQLVSVRAQLSAALADAGRTRSELSLKESEVQDKVRQAADAEMRLTLFRSYLSDSGIIVDEEEIASKGGDHPVRVQELESKLEERTRAYEQAVRDLERVKRARDEMENEAGALSSQLDRLRSSQSPGSNESGSEGRVVAAERKLAEAEQAHRERLTQMEGDYQTAVNYAKGTEKMLRRLKDELHKQRGVNTDLQNELKMYRAASPTDGSMRSGSRSVNGRGTPLSTEDSVTLSDAQRQNQRLISENADLSRRLETLQRDLEQLRDQLAATQRDADARLSHMEELEDEIRKLERDLEQARNAGDAAVVERLHKQNEALQRENEELTHRVGLLLEVDHATYGRARPISGVSFRRVSGSSDEHDLDDWRPTDRPLSDFDDDLDHPPFVEPTRSRS
ncbi:hypothetical protein EXIGLDRAFT_615741 [Exidia glandulosa HHB12029]|uniref:Galactose oxidase n=1 Tax=Exidia glandulosa HHB12029 TaxID=1314781 RepID=A0A165H1P6_EXIGL|nr:hypothetical protein EXIGLDRAFT_615741 [Exidia glandulosa HHB12029]